MRRPIAALLTVLTLTVAGLTATTTVVASAAPAPSATVEWPTGTVDMGGDAFVTVTGQDLTKITNVFLFQTSHYPDDTFEALDQIGPGGLTTTLRLPTTAPGDTSYTVVVGGVEGDPDFITRSDYTLTVNGLVSKVDVTFPTGPLTVGTKAPITGSVTGTPGRPVLIQQSGDNGTWVTLTQTKTRADGTFAVNAPTWWAATQRLRAYAPATETDSAVTSDTTSTVKVVRAYTPRGGVNSWTYLSARRARWNPCDTITYRVNPKNMPTGGLADVKWALHQVTQASGLRFSYAGPTTFVPLASTNRPGVVSRNADMTIAWATPKKVPALAKTVGRGGGISAQRVDGYEFTSGYAVLKAGVRYAKNPRANHNAAKVVMLHQIGHAMGLGSTPDKRQIMNEGAYRVPGLTPLFAAGDLTGLANLGAVNGCFVASP